MKRAAIAEAGRAWTGEFFLADAGAVFVGRGGETSRHRLMAHKLIVPLDGRARVERADGVVDVVEGLWVPAGVSHAVDTGGGRVALLYVETVAGSTAMRLEPDAPREWVEQLRAVAAGRLAPDAMFRGVRSPGHGDWRVERVLDIVRRDDAPVSLDALAASVGVSAGRLSHLVTDRLGVPLRRARAWLKLRRSLDLLWEGASVTEAAHGAGFADSAHLSRNFREAFGVPPSVLLRSELQRVAEPTAPVGRECGAGLAAIRRRAP